MADNTAAASPKPTIVDHTLPERVLRKATWRLIPFLTLLYLLNILDRGNLGFARLTMQKDLELTPEAFDIAYGIFYFGYLSFEVPANLLLRRIGARRWMARIMITWGIVSAATMAVTGPTSFYVVRILLGIAEAGFFPGIVLYLTYWFPARERVRVMAFFMTANSLAGVLGYPLSGAIMDNLNGVAGLAGWQWIFLLEGIPSVIVGFTVLRLLPDGPSQARWLKPEERDWLIDRMSREEAYRQQRHGSDLLRAMVDRRVWLLICIYFTVAVGANASGAYFPKRIDEHFQDYSKLQIGLLSALPNVCAIVGMTLLGIHSDRTGERPRHVAFAALLAAAGWALAGFAPSPWFFLAGLCLALMGMLSMLPPFWALPSAFLSGTAAAGGIALINSVANIGGAFGPTIFARIDLKGMIPVLLIGSALALCVRHDATLDKQVLHEKPGRN